MGPLSVEVVGEPIDHSDFRRQKTTLKIDVHNSYVTIAESEASYRYGARIQLSDSLFPLQEQAFTPAHLEAASVEVYRLQATPDHQKATVG